MENGKFSMQDAFFSILLGESMFKDIRHAVRVLLHAKAWTAVVLVSLALGIGANTAIFSAINGLLIKHIPVKDPETLVRLRWGGRNDMVTNSSDYGFSAKGADGQNVRTTFSFPMYQQFLADNKTMTDLLACAPYGRVNVVVDGQAEIASAFISTGNYYQVLGVSARLGRAIVPDDDQPSATAVAVISSKFWHRRFMTDPGVVGKTIRVNNVAVTIVGVLPPEFTGIQQAVGQLPDLAFPLSLDSQLNTSPGPTTRLNQPTYWWLQVMGRLKPEVTAAQVEGNLDGVFQNTARAGFDGYLKGLSEADRTSSDIRARSNVPRLRVDSGSRGVYDVNTNELRSATMLAIVVALVLLIVCANVANLLLSRAATRQKELSVRLSLGATRLRLIRQLLTESLLLAAAGGALGIAVGYWGKKLLPGPPGQATFMDWRVFAFVLGVTAVTGIVFGIAPALRATGGDVGAALKQNSRSIAGSKSLLSKSLLVVQVAISLVLLVGAGLFLRTLDNLRRVDVGFNPHNLLLFRVQPTLNRYDEKRTLELYGQLFERIAAVPGVRSVALTNPALLTGSVNSTSIFIRGRTYANVRESRPSINRLVVSPNFFETLEIPIVMGRGFTAADNAVAPKVVLINEAAARDFFPNESPVGQRFGSSPETSSQQEIIGVVRDAKYDSVRDTAPPTMYAPYLQARALGAVIAVRTAVTPSTITASVREAVRQADPNLPMMDVSTQLEQVELRFQQEKTFAQAYTLFGGLALLLAAIGLFGLMSYNVSRRTNEIGIRMALGAQRGDVLRLVMRESMILVAAGVVIGVGAALWASRFVTTQLFGLPGTDVATVAAAVAVMILVSAPAGFLPARRASAVDPMVALRYD
jgi:predicted permease